MEILFDQHISDNIFSANRTPMYFPINIQYSDHINRFMFHLLYQENDKAYDQYKHPTKFNFR